VILYHETGFLQSKKSGMFLVFSGFTGEHIPGAFTHRHFGKKVHQDLRVGVFTSKKIHPF
jgi:hypothetical protein